MIISHKHKSIFIKPQKNAGTSADFFPELKNVAIPITKKSDNKFLDYRDYYIKEEWIEWVSERSLNIIKKFKYEI